MKSFFAMSWDPEDPEAVGYAVRIADRLRRISHSSGPGIDGPGFSFHPISDQRDVHDVVEVRDDEGTCRGAVFGKIFRSSDGSRPARAVRSLTAAAISEILISDGAQIPEHFWGNYVALIRSREGVSVVVDPMASIPCFFTIRHGVLLVFSHLENCPFLDVRDFTLNRSFIALLLCYDKVQTGETGLNEVSELLGGQRLTLRRGRLHRDVLWDPRDVARNTLRVGTDEASDRLAQTTRSVVAGWASQYDRIRLNLSGGLDSSIVASCLGESCESGRVTAVHQIMESGDQTEVAFARAAAEHCGLALREVSQAAQTCLPDLNGHPASARPFRHYLGHRTATGCGQPSVPDADAIFTGQGGDHLFMVARTPLVFADYLRMNRPGPKTLSALYEAAFLSGRSVWQVMADALPGGFCARRDAALLKTIRERRTPVNTGLISDERLQALLPIWVTQPGGVPPAKFEQINMLTHLVHMRRPFASPGEPETVHPLMSQPLIHLCLRLPTYQLCCGGESRGLARRAFEGAIPELIRCRSTKGSAARYYRSRVALQREQLAAALLNGELVRNNILDRQSVEQFFTKRDDENHQFGHMVLIYYVIEAWLRTWTRLLRPSPLAAA